LIQARGGEERHSCCVREATVIGEGVPKKKGREPYVRVGKKEKSVTGEFVALAEKGKKRVSRKEPFFTRKESITFQCQPKKKTPLSECRQLGKRGFLCG